MTENTVPMSVYEQTAWERDLAVTQLKEIGKSLGERMDDVKKVVFCSDCRFSDMDNYGCCASPYCRWHMTKMAKNDYCSFGEKRKRNGAN